MHVIEAAPDDGQRRIMTGRRLARVGQLLCLGGAALGGLGLLGWVVGVPSLTTIVPGQPPMMPKTALALLLAGVAGALRHREHAGRVRRTLSLLAAVVVLALGAGTLVEYVVDLGLLEGSARADRSSARSSPPTALALAFLATALLLFDARPTARARPSEWLGPGRRPRSPSWPCSGSSSVRGRCYRLTRAPVIGVAVPTALGLLALAVGMLLERPGSGLMRVATSPGPGGILLRRLALAAVLASVVVGLALERLLSVVGVEGFPLVFATLAAALTATSLVLLVVTAVSLDRTHEALEWRRARTRALVEQASDGIFVADLDGRYTDVNSVGCRMLGYPREEIVGKTIVDLIPPEDAERLAQSKERLLEGDTDIAEWKLRRKDGTYLPVEVSAKILPDGRWQGLVRDISERKRAEEALRLSEAKSSGILSISADAIISIDEQPAHHDVQRGRREDLRLLEGRGDREPRSTSSSPSAFRAIHRRHVERFAAGQDAARRMGAGARSAACARTARSSPPTRPSRSSRSAGMRLLTVALRDVTEQKRIESEQRFLAEVGSVLASTPRATRTR